jgi:hypothetical protein
MDELYAWLKSRTLLEYIGLGIFIVLLGIAYVGFEVLQTLESNNPL